MKNRKNRDPEDNIPFNTENSGGADEGQAVSFSEQESRAKNSNEDISEKGGNDDILIDIPDEFSDEEPHCKKPKKPWSKKKKIVVWGIVGLLAAIIVFAAIYIYSIWSNPMAQFDSLAQQATSTPAPSEMTPALTDTASPSASDTALASASPSDSSSPSVSDSEDPYAAMLQDGDFSILEKYVNVLLIGVDYTKERKTWNGKHAYHSDVMIVVSINKETNEIHMISLPRDTYAKIPGVDGIYKLNASIDCGGGWPKKSGFEKVCQAASWMLGDNIPVKYYYAVDMAAVKGLVDTIGGVDYNLELNFKLMGRSYKKGQQHMNGQAVLDYLRVRKKISAKYMGDLNRINRQKKMLVTIFKQLQDSQLMFKIPGIIDTFNGSLYTNTNLAQTTALAAFAYKIDPNKIYMHSMDGSYHNIFNWRFVITNQKKRVDLIKDIYGIKVPQRSDYTYSAAAAKWANMQAKVIASKSKSVLSKVSKKLDADDKLAVKKYTDADRALYNKARSQANGLTSIGSTSAQESANKSLMSNIAKLCRTFKVSKPNWRVNYEKGSNEVYVDFR